MAALTITKQFTVKNVTGWHARPCAVIARTVIQHPDVTVTFSCPEHGPTIARGSSIFELMTLAINYGDSIIVTLTSENETHLDQLLKKLQKIITKQDLLEDF